MKQLIFVTLAASMFVAWLGCSQKTQQESAEKSASAKESAESAKSDGQPKGSTPREAGKEPAEPAKPDEPAEAAAPKPSPITTKEQLEAALREKNPKFKGEVGVRGDGQRIMVVGINDPAIKDISPLAGMPLVMLDLAQCQVTDVGPLKDMRLEECYLEGNPVRDISVLRGMPLVKFYASNTKIDDIGPLKGARFLQELNLIETAVADLEPLRGMPQLQMLWLTGCPVSDVGPLKDVPSLVSVTLAGTRVSDLGPFRNHPLQRLHIAGTQVTDLSPLEAMRLTRLIFTPGKITKGIEFAREMPTLREIDVAFPPPGGGRPMSPAMFWEKYDAGGFK